MVLKQQYIDELKTNSTLRLELALEVDVNPRTIERWVKDNSTKLTKKSVLKFLAKRFEKKQDQLVLKSVKAQ